MGALESAPVKFTGSNIFVATQKQDGHRRRTFLSAVHRPRTYQERTILDKATEREIIERYRLSREGINCLFDVFTGGNLERNTTCEKNPLLVSVAKQTALL